MTNEISAAKLIGLTLLLTLLTVALAASIVYATDVYLLAFLAVLTAILFTHVAKWLGRWLPISYGWNLALTVTFLVAVTVGTIFYFGTQIENQLEKTSNRLDQSYEKVVAWLQEHPTAMSAFQRVPFASRLLPESERPPRDQSAPNAEGSQKETRSQEGVDASNATRSKLDESSQEDTRPAQKSQSEAEASSGGSAAPSGVQAETLNSVSGKVFGVLGKLFSTTLGATMNVAFVFFVAVFLAAKPGFYRDHFAKLFPKKKRGRVRQILDEMADALFRWLQGRAATMLITGLGVTVVLWLLQVPLAPTLGIITGVLTFIPTVGAFLALLLSMLVALSQGPVTVAWVVVLYAVLQFVESNVITPLIQQHQTSVPPPLLLSGQLMMGVLTGFLGVLVSTPLLAAMIVLVREAYVNDVLGDEEVDAATEAES